MSVVAVITLSGQRADESVDLAVIGALAATFVAIELFFYLPSVRWLGAWYLRRTTRRLSQSRSFLRARRTGLILCVIDTAVVLAWRGCVLFYAAVLLLFVAPILLTLASLSLAAALVVR
jgi:hypothetical protein